MLGSEAPPLPAEIFQVPWSPFGGFDAGRALRVISTASKTG